MRMHGDAGDPGAQRHHEGDLADLEHLHGSQRSEREGDAVHNEPSDAQAEAASHHRFSTTRRTVAARPAPGGWRFEIGLLLQRYPQV
jgi:hypothetical protein